LFFFLRVLKIDLPAPLRHYIKSNLQWNSQTFHHLILISLHVQLRVQFNGSFTNIINIISITVTLCHQFQLKAFGFLKKDIGEIDSKLTTADTHPLAVGCRYTGDGALIYTLDKDCTVVELCYNGINESC
jgi:hypothetical protein